MPRGTPSAVRHRALRNASRERTHNRHSRDYFKPLHIRAWLETPVITDGTLPFDALLYFVAHRESCPPMDFTIPGAESREGHSNASVPLARCEEHGPNWYYACSFAQWPQPIAEGLEHWNKRVDESLCHLIDFAGRRGKIDIGSAAFKSYHMPVFYRHALYVDWYALGDAERIRELVRFTTHLGKKTSQGWGSVRTWEVEPASHDWSVRGPEGQLMRAVPTQNGHGILTGYRPSYWLPRNQALCLMP